MAKFTIQLVIRQAQTASKANLFRVRKDRGNIILTALFVSIFLFFLSVALLWSNRLDIALSLSMEHKLKAQSEARSMAMEAYGHLREFGEIRMQTTREAANGVESRLQLISKPPLDNRGDVLLVQCRATSGPVSAYYTLHLKETKLGDPSYPNPALFLPASQEAGGAGAIFGDFKYVGLGTGLTESLTASRGPIFQSSSAGAQSQPAFIDNPPVFTQDGSIAYVGPAVLIPPGLTEGQEKAFQWIKYQGGQLTFENIPPPNNLQTQPPEIDPRSTVIPLTGSGAWSNISVRGMGDELIIASWEDTKPAATSLEEIQDTLKEQPGFEASPLTDRSGTAGTQEWFIPSGTFTSSSTTMYTHGWHYLYQPFRGGVPDQITPFTAAKVTRWPCVLSYSTESGVWQKAWAPLRDSGEVQTDRVPSQSVLLATDDGTLYSVTTGSTRQLLTLDKSGRAEVGPTVPQGQMFIYQNEPYVVTAFGYQNVKSGETISIKSLPTHLAGQAGRVWWNDIGIIGIDEAGTNDLSPDGALDLSTTQTKTVMPSHTIAYTLTGNPAVAGNNIFSLVNISVETSAGETIDTETNGLFNEKYYEKYRPAGGTTLARFDGDRWQILPNGLRAFLERRRHIAEDPNQERPPGSTLDAPPGSDKMLAASYSGLPPATSRFAIICIDTDPFKFSND